jgi:hypothetical protein
VKGVNIKPAVKFFMVIQNLGKNLHKFSCTVFQIYFLVMPMADTKENAVTKIIVQTI